jgi:peptidoglycan/xylan/chitin deacetylase (PgdA/CDA1 family)
MKAVSLLYHDVVEPGRFEASGFRGPDADVYKLTTGEFRRHLSALAKALRSAPRRVWELGADRESGLPVLLTFDDGGASAFLVVAPLLAELGWRAHFFVTTDYIGQPGFLSAEEIRALSRLGHVLGSHSASHPPAMSRCTAQQLAQEWTRSTETLGAILGQPVAAASVPAGFYSRAVAEAAARAGIRFLFTSEPVVRAWTVGGCLALGRFGLQQGVTPERAAALVSGRMAPRLGSYAFWNAKKLVKAAGGEHWLRLRLWLLARRSQRRPPPHPGAR